MKFWAVREDRSLVPAGEASLDAFEKLPRGKYIEVTTRVPRSAKFHRFVFSLFGLIAKAFDEDPESVRHKLLVSMGEYREVRFPDGRVDRVPNSLSYEAMDDTKFRAFFEKLVKAIYTIYDVLPEDIRREIDAMLAPETERRAG